MFLNKHSLAVAKVAPKDICGGGSRYTMNAIQVTDAETVATNGEYLVRVSHPASPQSVENWPIVPGFDGKPSAKLPMLIDAKVALDALKAIPRKEAIPILNNAAIYQKDGETTLVVTDLKSPRSFLVPPMTGTFPKWQHVFPTGKVAAEVTLDANYVAMLAKHAADFGGNWRPVVLRVCIYDGEFKAVRFDATNDNTGQGWTALLMPLRSEAEHKYGYGDPAKVAETVVP